MCCSSVLQCVVVCCSVLQCRNDGTHVHMSKVSMFWVYVCTSVLQCVVLVCCSVLQCVAVCCSVLQCVAVQESWHTHTHEQGEHVIGYVCCSVLQCVAVCCSIVLRCIAVCCSVMQYRNDGAHVHMSKVRLSFTYACCSVLQCVAVCCSVLHCVEHEIGVFLHQNSTDGHRVNSYSISIYTPIYIHTYM